MYTSQFALAMLRFMKHSTSLPLSCSANGRLDNICAASRPVYATQSVMQLQNYTQQLVKSKMHPQQGSSTTCVPGQAPDPSLAGAQGPSAPGPAPSAAGGMGGALTSRLFERMRMLQELQRSQLSGQEPGGCRAGILGQRPTVGVGKTALRA